MGKVKFIFCAHNHQPVGNFDWVFEKAYQVAYKPFMQVMLKHPKIKWSLHASGMIWEFLEKEHPEYIKMLKILFQAAILKYYQADIMSLLCLLCLIEIRSDR